MSLSTSLFKSCLISRKVLYVINDRIWEDRRRKGSSAQRRISKFWTSISNCVWRFWWLGFLQFFLFVYHFPIYVITNVKLLVVERSNPTATMPDGCQQLVVTHSLRLSHAHLRNRLGYWLTCVNKNKHPAVLLSASEWWFNGNHSAQAVRERHNVGAPLTKVIRSDSMRVGIRARERKIAKNEGEPHQTPCGTSHPFLRRLMWSRRFCSYTKCSWAGNPASYTARRVKYRATYRIDFSVRLVTGISLRWFSWLLDSRKPENSIRFHSIPSRICINVAGFAYVAGEE